MQRACEPKMPLQKAVSKEDNNNNTDNTDTDTPDYSQQGRWEDNNTHSNNYSW